MSPMEIKGETLGQRHRHYNSIVKAAAKDETYILEEINYEDSDAANLLKMEVACARRDAAYTLRVLRGGDALLVARALRRGAWLLADAHAHLLRPDHLHAHLFPHLNVRTKNQLLLFIRLNLKNEQRVDEFYMFYKDDFKYAQKWLYHCSTNLILSVIREKGINLNEDTKNRLIKKSFVVFKALCRSMPYVLRSGNHYLYSDTDNYFDLIDSYEEFYVPKMGKKATRLLLQKYSKTIIDNFDKYCRKIDLSALAEHLQENQIQHFLLMQKQSNRHGLRSWVKYRYVRHFIKRLPVEDRFKFVKETFMEHERKIILEDDSQREDWETVVSGINLKTHYYRWYRYAPFDTAFFEIQALLMRESSPGERNAMLSVLIKCAAHDLHNIKTLVQFYQKKFIGEPFRYKIHFVNTLIALTKTHEYDELTWNMLHDIYCSMDIYLDVDNSKTVSNCVQSIVVYKILHGQNIPPVIEKKITIISFNNISRKLEPLENNKVFTYLYNYALNNLNNININSELDMVNAVKTTNEVLSFVEVWNRSIPSFPALLKKIKDLVEIKKRNSSWNIDLSIFYKDHKSFRRHLFKMSFDLCPTDETCVNALKHDPNLLSRYKSEVEVMCSKDAVPMKQTLRKLRLFWPDTIARQWEDFYLGRLTQHIGQKAIIRGLFSLQPRENCMVLIEKYVPESSKINFNEQSNSTELNVRKNIAQQMHLIRPPIDLDTVLLYAKGDYLRFTVPSLNTILQNMSRTQAVPYVHTLLNTPVGLQKHGIRFVLSKLNVTELTKDLLNLWKSSTNFSIKTGLFKQTYKCLCKEKELSRIEELWELLSILIENLPPNNKKLISNRFNKLEAIPVLVKHKFFMKSYLYLRSYRVKTANEMLHYIDQNMDMLIHLEIGFMEEVLLRAFRESVDGEDDYCISEMNMKIITAYVISSNSEDDQHMKYKTLLVPVMERLFALRHVRKYGLLIFRDLFTRLLEHLIIDMRILVILKKCIIPVQLFKHIQIWILNAFSSIKEEYNLITFWNIAVLLIEKFEEYAKEESFHETVSSLVGAPTFYYCMEDEPMWGEISSGMAPLFGASLLNYFKQDISSTYPTMFAFASKSIMDILVCLHLPYKNCYKILKYMLADKNAVTCYYVAIGVLRCMYLKSKYTSERFVLNEDLKKIMLSHPSMEVRILYNQCNSYNPFVSEMHGTNWLRPGFTDRRY